MKKFILSLILIFISAHGCMASSDDVYLRKDVFDAKFERMLDEFVKIHRDIDELKTGQNELAASQRKIIEELAKQSARIDVLSERVDQIDRKIDLKTDAFDKKIDSLSHSVDERLNTQNNILYWLIMIACAVIATPAFKKFAEWRKERKII